MVPRDMKGWVSSFTTSAKSAIATQTIVCNFDKTGEKKSNVFFQK